MFLGLLFVLSLWFHFPKENYMAKFVFTTDEDLETMIYNIVSKAFQNGKPNDQLTSTPEPLIKGIHSLGKFLNVSAPRAQKLKNEKVISCFQDGRLVLFDPKTVRAEMAAYNQRKKR